MSIEETVNVITDFKKVNELLTYVVMLDSLIVACTFRDNADRIKE
jgi:hypothetical protein